MLSKVLYGSWKKSRFFPNKWCQTPTIRRELTWDWVTWEKEKSFKIIVIVVAMRVAEAGSAMGWIIANEEGFVAVGPEWQEFDGNGA